MQAYTAVKNDKISARKASKLYQVPLTTLRDRLDERINIEIKSSGPVSFLGQDVEEKLVQHVQYMAQIGYGYTRLQIIELASQFAHSCQKLAKEKYLSQQWYNGFIRRWPNLKNIKPSSLDAIRARATNPEKIQDYFKELDKILTKYNLKERPDLIYNIDEKGISCEHKPPYIVCNRSLKAQAITSPRSSKTTLIAMGNALGNYVPPFFIFPGARMRDGLMKGATAGAKGTVSPTGWSNSDTFKLFLQTHASVYAKCSADEHMLWIYDGHSTHVNPSIIDWARSNRIILFVLPAHHSHILQPLDVGCFGPLQKIYNIKAQKFLRENPGEIITRYEVAQLASSAYVSALSARNLMNSFKKTGIYSYNPEAYDQTKTFPNEVFHDVDSEVDVDHIENPSEQNLVESQEIGAQSNANATQTKDLENDPQTSKVISNVVKSSSDSNIVQFLDSKLVKINPVKKRRSRKSVSTVVSGKAITEDETLKKVSEYEQMKKPKTNPNGKGKKAKGKTAKRKLSKERMSVTPGPSHYMVSSDDSENEVHSENEDICCVCKKYSPAGLREVLYNRIMFVKWAQCQHCGHWVHVRFCTGGVDIRRTSCYFCPCCSNGSENMTNEQ